jgi:hypothetical protein
MIKVGDTFKAGDKVWTVDKFVYSRNNAVYLRNYEKEKEFGLHEILVDASFECAQKHNKYRDLYAISYDEMCMCIEIIDKLKKVGNEND